MLSPQLPERLRAARAAAQLSQEKVAEKIGVTAQTVASWEQGRTTPNATDLARLATVYAVSSDWLLALCG